MALSLEIALAQVSGEGVDPTLFLGTMTLLFGALSTVSGLLYRRVSEEVKEVKDENKELKKRLDEYGRFAPPLIEAAEQRMVRTSLPRSSSPAAPKRGLPPPCQRRESEPRPVPGRRRQSR